MNIMEDVQGFSKEDVFEFEKAEAESRAVAKGSYEGIVFSWNEIDDEKKGVTDLYKGVPIYKVGVRCFDYPEPGKSQIAWVKVSGSKVFGEKGRLKAASAAGLQLTKVMGMFDQPITEVLEQAKVTRALYSVETWDKEDLENPDQKIVGGNWLKGVRAL